MSYKDKDKQREAVAKAARKYRAKVQGITQGITVSQAEIDALPQALKNDINRLCDSDPVKYDDRQERLVRAVVYRRKFPDRAYRSSCLTGDYDTGPDLAIQARLGKHTEQGNVRVAKPGDEEYTGVAEAVMARMEAK